MSSYERLTVVQLRDLCERRDIYCSGLRKPELIDILREYDAHIDAETVDDDVDDVGGRQSDGNDEMLDQGMDGPDCDAGHVVDDRPLPSAGERQMVTTII